MTDDTVTAVREFIASNFMYREGVDTLMDTDSLLGKRLIDSTGMLELVFFIESTFGVKVNDDEMQLENLDSIQRIASFVRRRTAPVAQKFVA